MKKATKQELLKLSIEQAEKYCDLVWYARSKQKAKSFEEKYPNEIKALQGEYGDWYHGFNSGCLAAFRMILTGFENGIDEANKNFPELDS